MTSFLHNNKSLNIWGIESPFIDLEYDRDDWNTMLIQYSRITEKGTDDKCFLSLNGRRGFFKPRVHKHFEESEMFLGGHPERKNFANVVLVNFEVYSKIFDNTPDSESSYIVHCSYINFQKCFLFVFVPFSIRIRIRKA